jgi:hypothetical protein
MGIALIEFINFIHAEKTPLNLDSQRSQSAHQQDILAFSSSSRTAGSELRIKKD